MLMGGADDSIPPESVARLRDTVPVEAELVVYDGAPHAFFDRRFAEHAEACADAWKRIAAFVGRYPDTA